MEPVAPGTEDDVVDFNSLNKKETENDRLLNQKVLKNGKVENVFELTYVNGGEHWFCKICECPVMGRVYQHELGRRHSINMSQITKRPEKIAEEPQGSEEGEGPVSTLEIAPGQPVPPGFEEEIEVTRQAKIQERLDGFKVGPLVALEYLIEMQDYDPSKEPFYLCILCDKKGDPRTVLTHLASYNHISQYLQKHFPSCYRALAPYMTKQYKRNWQVVLQKIAEAIEKKFGRLRPFCIDKDKFEKDRMHYLTMISKGKHFSEQSGPTFCELVVHDELTKTFDDDGRPVKSTASNFGGKAFIEREPIKQAAKRSPSPPVVVRPMKKTRGPDAENNKPPGNGKPTSRSPVGAEPRRRRRSLSSVSSLSSEDDRRTVGRRMARNRSPPPRDGGRRPYDNRDNRGAIRRRSPSPKYRFNKDNEEERRKNREKERQQKVEEFQKLSKAIETDIDKTLKQYEKNPEKHPKYNDEWKMFWNRRYKELQVEGKDPSKHDFKPEWIEFWGKRMRELSDEELKNRKDGLRKRLGLPEEANPICFRIGGGPSGANLTKLSRPKENRPNMPMAARPDVDPEIIFLDDKDDIEPPKKTSIRDRSHSPWESDTSPPRGTNKSRRSPGLSKRRVGVRSNDRSRERSYERRRSVERERRPERSRRSAERGARKSAERSRRSPDSRGRRSPDSRGPDRSRRSPDSRGPERGRRSPDRSSRLRFESPKERSLRRSPGAKRSPEFYRGGRDFSREKDYIRERDLDIGFPSTERSRDRGIRESSYERDIRGRDRIRTVAELPWEREKMMYTHDDYYGPPHMMRDARKPQLNFIPPPDMDDEPDAEEVNIVSVLRLLTALEERLGSLGPKIIDLLAQALALEKKEPNSSETLLDNEINCVMFETVKEKLKGQLLAGLVDIHQEHAFKKAIQKTANLIHMASQRKKERAPLVQAAVAVPGVGAVDKAAIAKQLANALIAQGKTDVTQDELEQLINAVVGMAEASKGSNKPMTAAGFLSQLTGGKEEPKEKIIIPRVKPSEEKRDKVKDVFADLEDLTEPLSPGTPERSATSNMENLSDSDLQTLLQNFKDLSTDEQMNLINYLKKLEYNEPDRVERLRKFVNLGSDKTSKDVIDLDTSPNRNGKESPYSSPSRYDKQNKDEAIVKIHLDSEDEDYSYEDVVKAASKNVKQKEMENNRKIVEDSIEFTQAQTNLTDAKTLISNLMGSISGNSTTCTVNMLGLPTSNTTKTPTSSADFAKALGSINMDSLASIVSSVQKAQENKINFEHPPQENSDSSSNDRFIPSENRPINPKINIEKLVIIPPSDSKRPMTIEHPNRAESLGSGQSSLASSGGLLGSGPTSRPPSHGLAQSGPGLGSTRFGTGQMGQGQMRQGPGPMGSQGLRPVLSQFNQAVSAPPRLLGLGSQPTQKLGGISINLRPSIGGPSAYPQRGSNPNQFGNLNPMNQRMPRQQFNPSFNNPRYSGPRGSGYNNRW